MNYKFSIDEKKLKKLLQPNELESEEKMDIESTQNNQIEQTNQAEVNVDGKNELDYYLKQLNAYNGKTIDEIVRDKYQPEKQPLDETTDDELYSRAKAYADSYKAEKQTKLQNTADTNANKLREESQKVQQKSGDVEKAIQNKYEQEVIDSKNSAIKRGIARSSIIENLLSEHQTKKDELSKENFQATKAELDSINQKIKKVEDDLSVALQNLDMETAVRLNDELASLKSSRDKANLSANKYNAMIEDRIQQYKKELIKSDEGKAILDYIESGKGELFANAKIALTKYIDNLPIDVAIEEISKEEYSRLFGNDVVKELKDYLDRKKEHYN